LSERIVAESDFFKAIALGSLITPGFGRRVYFPTGKGSLVLQVMPVRGTRPHLNREREKVLSVL
jgi:hypothetical protein